VGSRVGDILTMFRRHGPLTRADVARQTGLSRATVNARLNALLTAGLLVADGEETPTRGRPAGHFAFNSSRGVLLVADIGATAMRTVLCDLSGRIIEERSESADITDGPAVTLTVVQELFDQMLSAAERGADEVLGVGLDVPGPVDIESGQVISPPIMTGWDRYDIPSWFASHYACPVLVDKDVNAMAFGENRIVHPNVPNMLFVKIGTGVGSGIIANGQTYRGADGAAGDIGHNQIPIRDDAPEPLCRCGNTGCVEAYAGGWALVRDLRAEGKEVPLDLDEEGRCLGIREGDAGEAKTRAQLVDGTVGFHPEEALPDALPALQARLALIPGPRVDSHRRPPTPTNTNGLLKNPIPLRLLKKAQMQGGKRWAE